MKMLKNSARNRSSHPTFRVTVEGQPAGEICTRSCVTISASLLRKRVGMPSGTHMPSTSRARSATTTGNSDCACADDGKGIDPAVLANQGLEGHYGLRGMPERGALIGGKLTVWGEVGAGTEVELRLVLARTVYATSPEAFLVVTAVCLPGTPA